jgi:hypothetical protein
MAIPPQTAHRICPVMKLVAQDCRADYAGQVLACGPACSLIIFNGSVWHGHTANKSSTGHRSIQGYFVRREARSGIDLYARVRSETSARIGPLGRYVLAV